MFIFVAIRRNLKLARIAIFPSGSRGLRAGSRDEVPTGLEFEIICRWQGRV